MMTDPQRQPAPQLLNYAGPRRRRFVRSITALSILAAALLFVLVYRVFLYHPW